MKYLLLVLLLSPFALLADEKDYVAKSEDGEVFCARVEVATVTGTRKVKKCRTIQEWEKAGYTVSKKSQDAEA
jgi:hypothetical protein